MNGAIPGKQLLEQRRQRISALQRRLRAHATAAPNTTSGAASLPGILLRPQLPAGAVPTSVVAGDFNNDGHLDFIVANGVTSDLWLSLGIGDGTFQLPRVIPLSKGLSPIYMAVADFNGDGNLDLAVAEFDTSTIGILLGKGDGTFGYEQQFSLPQPPAAITINDFNHDGKLDIAAVMTTAVLPNSRNVPYIALLTGNGTGGFNPPVISDNWGFYSTAWNIDSGDVNGDGLPDLLITGPDLDNSTIYINNGDGTFKSGATVSQNGLLDLLYDGRLADINGDGCLDAVIADGNTRTWVYPGNCSGDFAAPSSIPMGDGNAAVRITDINGDGHPDIITGSLAIDDPNGLTTQANTVNVAFGDGKGNFSTARTYVATGEVLSLAFADFNGDGFPDIVTANSDMDSATVLMNDRSGAFGLPQGLYAGPPTTALEAGLYGPSFADLNRDGKPDLLLISSTDNGDFAAMSYLGDGTGRLALPLVSDSGYNGSLGSLGDFRLGDFRNTGHLDILGIGPNVAFSGGSQYIFFLPGNGDGTFGKATVTPTPGADGLLTTGDFNRDGKLDFVAVNGDSTHTLTLFLGNGDGTFRTGTSVTFSDKNDVISQLYTGDFNRDGKLDILVFATSNGYWTTSTAVWEFDGNGNGTFQPGRELFTPFQPFTLADLNGDGYPDIARYDFMWPDGITETNGPAKFTNYLGKSDGTFSQISSYAPYSGTPKSFAPFMEFGDNSSSSIVADLSADGKPDEIAFQGDTNGTYAQSLMGNGDGTFTPTYDVFPFYLHSYPVWAHPLGSDGIPYLLQIDQVSSAVQIYKAGPAPTLQVALETPIVTGNSGCGYIFPDLASASDRTATLSSTIAGVILPSSLAVPANATSAKFCFTLAPNFDWHQVFDITATLDGGAAMAYASQTYSLGFTEAVSATNVPPVYAGQSTGPVTITFTAAPAYSSTVTLSCEGMPAGDSCQFGSGSIQISPASPATTTVVFHTAAGTGGSGLPAAFTIVADDGNIIHRQTVSVPVAALAFGASENPTFTAVSPGTTSGGIYVSGIPPYTFSCSGLPAGASCAFSGAQAAYPAPSTITATLSIPSGIATGNYPFQIAVSSGSLSAGSPATLQVISYTLQPPPAPNDWGFPGSVQNVPITILGSSNASGLIAITCKVPVGMCTSPYGNLAPSPTTTNLSINIPANAAPAADPISITATIGSATQSYNFPFYIATLSGSLSSQTLNLTPGGSGQVKVTLSSTNGFQDQVEVACLPNSSVSCVVSPQYPQLTGAAQQTVTITLTAASTLASSPSLDLAQPTRVLALLLPVGFLIRARRKLWRAIFLVIIGVLVPLCLLSCGGSGTGGNGSGTGGSGGDSGSSQSAQYPITIVATPVGTAAQQSIGIVTVNVTR